MISNEPLSRFTVFAKLPKNVKNGIAFMGGIITTHGFVRTSGDRGTICVKRRYEKKNRKGREERKKERKGGDRRRGKEERKEREERRRGKEERKEKRGTHLSIKQLQVWTLCTLI